MMKRGLVILLACVIAIGFFVYAKKLISVGCIRAADKALVLPQADLLVKREAPVKTVVTGETDLRTAFVKVAGKVGPAVVSISTERTQKIGFPREQFFMRRFGRQSPFGGEDPFEKFFEDFFGSMPEKEFKQQGLGSGVLIDQRGYILTNEHVVSGAEKITITLPDGRSFSGTIVGADQRSDIAVIQIKADNLPIAELGDSDLLQTGEWVVALGNPFGHILKSPQPTVTTGVVSALHRHIPTPDITVRGYLDMIQTDAAINPGNSGGPLCDIDGKVIGVNVAIFSTSGGYQGVGFAIPINTAKEILGDLIQGKKIEYGWLGIQIQEINPDIAEFFKLQSTEGALVAKVIPQSPAEKGGLREGDVILKFNGEKVLDVNDLLKKIARTRIGQTAALDIVRDGKNMAINVAIAARPSSVEVKKEESAPVTGESVEWRGMRVISITNQIKEGLHLEDTRGVVIAQIDPNGQAYKAGLREGDVIKEINKETVDDIYQYNKITSEAKGSALVRTERGYFIVK